MIPSGGRAILKLGRCFKRSVAPRDGATLPLFCPFPPRPPPLGLLRKDNESIARGVAQPGVIRACVRHQVAKWLRLLAPEAKSRLRFYTSKDWLATIRYRDYPPVEIYVNTASRERDNLADKSAQSRWFFLPFFAPPNGDIYVRTHARARVFGCVCDIFVRIKFSRLIMDDHRLTPPDGAETVFWRVRGYIIGK